jgi:hypothetical protein
MLARASETFDGVFSVMFLSVVSKEEEEEEEEESLMASRNCIQA